MWSALDREFRGLHFVLLVLISAHCFDPPTPVRWLMAYVHQALQLEDVEAQPLPAADLDRLCADYNQVLLEGQAVFSVGSSKQKLKHAFPFVSMPLALELAHKCLGVERR